jgi:hypothetical protein
MDQKMEPGLTVFTYTNKYGELKNEAGEPERVSKVNFNLLRQPRPSPIALVASIVMMVELLQLRRC